MKKKIIALCLIVALAATAVVGGTLAYFTDTTETVQNVFTTGDVEITLTEPNWDADAKADLNHAKLIPGRRIAKDPTIAVVQGSEKAYTFLKVTLSEDFADLLTAYAEVHKLDLTKEADQKALISAWFESKVSPKIMSIDLKTYSVILGVLSPKTSADPAVTYFDAITVPDDVTAEMIEAAGSDFHIDVTAYAIQAEGFEPTGPFENEAAKEAAMQTGRQDAFNALFK